MEDMLSVNIIDNEHFRNMSKNKLSSILRHKTKLLASQYLKNMVLNKTKGSKLKLPGSEMEMAKYLQPNYKSNINERKQIFLLRSGMLNLGINFSKKNGGVCPLPGCLDLEDLRHVFVCTHYNDCLN